MGCGKARSSSENAGAAASVPLPAFRNLGKRAESAL
jgi:hypothetical protein